MTVEQYTTQAERDALLVQYSSTHRLVEDRNHSDGNFLVFAENSEPIPYDPEDDKVEIKQDALLTNIKSKTPQQAADWVDANVTDLATAKTVLKAYAKAICYLLRNMDD